MPLLPEDCFELKAIKTENPRETTAPPLNIKKNLNWRFFPEKELFSEINFI